MSTQNVTAISFLETVPKIDI
jgi:hypothetical protein